MEALLGFLMIGFIIALYFLPTIIAVTRQKSNAVMIATVNLLFGWLFVPWLLSLAWAANGRRGE